MPEMDLLTPPTDNQLQTSEIKPDISDYLKFVLLTAFLMKNSNTT